MKIAAFTVLLVSMATIIYFFIKEQFKAITLSHAENLILSITYLAVGISLLILFRLKNAADRKKDHPKD